MAIEIPNNSINFEIDKSRKDWLLFENASIEGHDGYGLFEASNFHDNAFIIGGHIIAVQPGGAAILSRGTNTSVSIAEFAGAAGWDGIVMEGRSAEIDNSGAIVGSATALVARGDRADIDNAGQIYSFAGLGVDLRNGNHAHLKNSGEIDGKISVLIDEAATVVNEESGLIKGDTAAFVLHTSAGERTTITNRGSIEAIDVLRADDGAVTFVNRGIIKGDILLGTGNDLFDSRGGEFDGTIFDSGGNDTYRLALNADIVEQPGGGRDTIETTNSLSLIANIENLTLLGKADTFAFGNELNNVLRGNSGDNVLSGAAGNDRLFGGAGHDTFQFDSGSGKDSIIDFRHGADLVNLQGLDGIDDFSDLRQHHLRVRGDDLVIHEGNDTLILLDTERSSLSAADFLF